jgi:hypothetical protein
MTDQESDSSSRDHDGSDVFHLHVQEELILPPPPPEGPEQKLPEWPMTDQESDSSRDLDGSDVFHLHVQVA